MAIPQPMTTWDSFCDLDEASIAFLRPGSQIRAGRQGMKRIAVMAFGKRENGRGGLGCHDRSKSEQIVENAMTVRDSINGIAGDLDGCQHAGKV